MAQKKKKMNKKINHEKDLQRVFNICVDTFRQQVHDELYDQLHELLVKIKNLAQMVNAIKEKDECLGRGPNSTFIQIFI